ncbi:hypothetical protein MAPG_12058 [Magnaporthiopsis poae ATCC 64411]|uniref:Uncharacterized protein n=1 Tax=Magnaporthiopsis poae (strain ATCC 64411 / 73-15) TaxID=644358 RepID=A0A0C4EGR5_MAGP6|nr:hypothetical protein MAPG_12058 [Magnaporthiopsis poae ATCC 64411]
MVPCWPSLVYGSTSVTSPGPGIGFPFGRSRLQVWSRWVLHSHPCHSYGSHASRANVFLAPLAKEAQSGREEGVGLRSTLGFGWFGRAHSSRGYMRFVDAFRALCPQCSLVSLLRERSNGGKALRTPLTAPATPTAPTSTSWLIEAWASFSDLSGSTRIGVLGRVVVHALTRGARIHFFPNLDDSELARILVLACFLSLEDFSVMCGLVLHAFHKAGEIYSLLARGRMDQTASRSLHFETPRNQTIKNLVLHAHGQEITIQTNANELQTINKGGLDLSLQVSDFLKKNRKRLDYAEGVCKKQEAAMDEQAAVISNQGTMLEEHATTIKQQAAVIEKQAATIKQQAEEIEDLKATVAKLVSWA